jgi:Protein of unknown function (DUF3810)
MGVKRVKHKLPIAEGLFALACVTFLASWGQLFPREMVETWYARGLFPTVSSIFGVIADAIPISLIDPWILLCVSLLIYCVLRRRWRLLVGAASFFYLWFFWGWGLNYHRPPLADRLHLDPGGLGKPDFEAFAETAAREINRLWPLASKASLSREEISNIAGSRVERVVEKIDGTDWRISRQVKHSFLLEPWYRGAGIDGMFNPFGHEALIVNGLLPFEMPFLMSHEIAHVRGIANEGEANLVALLATLASDDPRFQYSGWLYVWGYLAGTSRRLDPGPTADLRAVRDRILSSRIGAISNVQTTLLDAHLKANAVPGGIRSYSDFVRLAIVSQSRWKEFR